MKKTTFFIYLVTCVTLVFTTLSCDDDDDKDKPKGFVTFGANYNIVNCPTTVTIYLDGKKIGTLSDPVDNISDCDQEGTIAKEISVGEHSYKVEIRSESNCLTKDLTGKVVIFEDECEKIFIDYSQIFDDVCNQDVIIDENEYEDAPNDRFAIHNMEISGDCLKIRFSASGCDGNSWVTKLIDLGSVVETNPCQRTLRLSLKNNEACEAVITKAISFNIEDLQIEGDDKVLLNISGKSILYEY
ncbi:hypothetical protein D0T53_09125 [Dysgonomonas sp. 216]|uniref:hypothetical protein n=1 Tax=Dysgonomonas sp. 216 TaxID=2302934 RepID=UPI0013D23368|nr:hypothetical protein [Dysgonomonas sp. 216]NDW19073.1 hypothetical protein [Dysgonomonas sp. 216]